MTRYEFELHLRPFEYLRFYEGTAKHVVVQATNGKTVQLPAAMFRSFVTPEGVHGRFVLTLDANGKSLGLERI